MKFQKKEILATEFSLLCAAHLCALAEGRVFPFRRQYHVDSALLHITVLSTTSMYLVYILQFQGDGVVKCGVGASVERPFLRGSCLPGTDNKKKGG
jgi:hypothetical protein